MIFFETGTAQGVHVCIDIKLESTCVILLFIQAMFLLPP